MESCRQHYNDFFLSVAESVDAEGVAVVGPEVSSWIERMDEEHVNIAALLHHAQATGDADLGMRLAAATWTYWHVRSHFSAGRAWLERMLALSSARTATRVRALRGAGYLAFRQADYAAAEAAFAESLETARHRDDQVGIARAMHGLGLVAMRRGDGERARELLEQVLVTQQSLGNVAWQALILNFLGELALNRGLLDIARRHFEESMAIRQELGDRWGTPQLLFNLGFIAHEQGDLPHARGLYLDALGQFEALQSKHGIADCLEGLAAISAEFGQPERAATLIGTAAQARQSIGTPLPAARAQRLERLLAPARRAFGEDAWQVAVTNRRQTVLGDAIALAFETPEAAPGTPADQVAPRIEPRVPANRVLTERECEVAALVARGLSNAQIADCLMISAATAAVHVKHILAKLEFATRAQIAAWYAVTSDTNTPIG